LLCGLLTQLGNQEVFAAGTNLDPSFGTGGMVVTSVSGSEAHDALLQPDGKIVVVGTEHNRIMLVRYSSDGSLDSTFGTNGITITDYGPNALNIDAGALQADGRIVVAGLTAANNVTRADFFLARYNSDGTIDSTFGDLGRVITDFSDIFPGGAEVIMSLAVQSDGKIIAGGVAEDATTDGFFAIVRYNYDGTLDQTFGSNGKVFTDFTPFRDSLFAVMVLGDGKILAGGSANNNNSGGLSSNFALARYNADGTLDQSFGVAGKTTTDFTNNSPDIIHGLAIQPDGKIVACGFFPFKLARYTPDGILDTSFGNAGKVVTTFVTGPQANSSAAFKVAIQSDGNIIAAGQQNVVGSDFAVARYNSDGTLNSNFGVGGKALTHFPVFAQAFGLVVQPNDQPIAVGGVNAFVLTRYLNAAADVTPPSVSCDQLDDQWHENNVSITCHAGDPSGLVGDNTFVLFTSVGENEENSSAVTNQRTVCDSVNNCVTVGPIGPIRVDRKSPTVNLSSPASRNYLPNEVVPASFFCTDASLVSCVGTVASGDPIDTSSIGTKTFSVAATDALGHTFTQTVDYTVFNTGAGSNVVVDTNEVLVQFSNVQSPGTTSVNSIDPITVGNVPGGFAVSNTAAYQIQTTAAFTAPIIVGFRVPGPISLEDFNSLTVLHNENGVLVDVTATEPARDYSSLTVFGVTDSFSPFYVVRTSRHLKTLFDQTKAYKAGSTIPIKVQLNSQNSNVSTSAIQLTARSLILIGGNTNSAVIDSGNANSDGNFRYDSSLGGTGGGYIFNLSTKGMVPGTYLMTVVDGSNPSFFYTIRFEVK